MTYRRDLAYASCIQDHACAGDHRFISYVTIRDFGLPRVPREIHLTYPAVQYTADDPAAVIHTTLEIEGTYYRYLFHHPTFKGVVRVHEHDFTMLESEIMEYPLYAYDRIYKASPDVRDSILTSFLSYPIWSIIHAEIFQIFNLNISESSLSTTALNK